jgi:hypothetical protein
MDCFASLAMTVTFPAVIARSASSEAIQPLRYLFIPGLRQPGPAVRAILNNALNLAAVPQARRNAVDGDLDSAQNLLIRIMRAMFLQKFDLHMV